MEIISAKNPQRTATGIDLIVTFDGMGEVPYHATPTDSTEHGQLLYAMAESGEFGVVQPIPAVIPEVPSSVTPRQAKLALLSAGLLDDVEAAIDAITDATQKRTAQIEWEYAQEIRRDWPLLNQLASDMGMTDAQLDELFTAAAGL